MTQVVAPHELVATEFEEVYRINHTEATTAPDWQDNPGGYYHTSTMTPLIYIDGELQGSDSSGQDDLLVAFGPDGTIRGVSSRFPLPHFSPFYQANEDGIMCHAVNV